MTRVIDTIALGFSIDPLIRWLFPEPKKFLATFPVLVRLYAEKALEHQSAYHIDNYAGSTLWLPPGIHQDEEGLTRLFQDIFSGSMQEDVLSLFEQMDMFHPDEPCYYLTFIAVDPAQQGNGYGSRLLEHTLKLCDSDKVPAYLESSNPTNLSLYKRFGFELVGNIQVGASPPVFPMIRAPQ